MIFDFDQRFVISDWRGSKRLIELCMANERQLEQVTVGGLFFCTFDFVSKNLDLRLGNVKLRKFLSWRFDIRPI